MPLIEDATKVYVGTQQVSKIYIGTDLVWETSEFSPDQITGLGLWLDASQLALANGATVSPWPDLSGAGRNAAVVDTAPVYRATAFNGHPTVEFVGGTGLVQRLQVAGLGTALSGKTQYTMFLVLNAHTLSQSPAIGDAPTGAAYEWLLEYDTAGGLFWSHGNGKYRSYAAVTTVNTPHLLTLHHTPSGPRLYRTSTEMTSYTLGPSGDTAQTVPSLGADFLLTGYFNGALGFDGFLSEVLWYDHALTTTERVNVETYLKTKWGL
jgi:hypothetical protein